MKFHYHITRNLEIGLKLNLSCRPGLAASRELPAVTRVYLASVLELWSLLGWAILEVGNKNPLTGTSVRGHFSLGLHTSCQPCSFQLFLTRMGAHLPCPSLFLYMAALFKSTPRLSKKAHIPPFSLEDSSPTSHLHCFGPYGLIVVLRTLAVFETSSKTLRKYLNSGHLWSVTSLFTW